MLKFKEFIKSKKGKMTVAMLSVALIAGMLWAGTFAWFALSGTSDENTDAIVSSAIFGLDFTASEATLTAIDLNGNPDDFADGSLKTLLVGQGYDLEETDKIYAGEGFKYELLLDKIDLGANRERAVVVRIDLKGFMDNINVTLTNDNYATTTSILDLFDTDPDAANYIHYYNSLDGLMTELMIKDDGTAKTDGKVILVNGSYYIFVPAGKDIADYLVEYLEDEGGLLAIEFGIYGYKADDQAKMNSFMNMDFDRSGTIEVTVVQATPAAVKGWFYDPIDSDKVTLNFRGGDINEGRLNSAYAVTFNNLSAWAVAHGTLTDALALRASVLDTNPDGVDTTLAIWTDFLTATQNLVDYWYEVEQTLNADADNPLIQTGDTQTVVNLTIALSDVMNEVNADANIAAWAGLNAALALAETTLDDVDLYDETSESWINFLQVLEKINSGIFYDVTEGTGGVTSAIRIDTVDLLRAIQGVELRSPGGPLGDISEELNDMIQDANAVLALNFDFFTDSFLGYNGPEALALTTALSDAYTAALLENDVADDDRKVELLAALSAALDAWIAILP